MSTVSENSSLSVDYDFDCGLFDDDFLAGDDAMLLEDFEIREQGKATYFAWNLSNKANATILPVS